MRLTKAKAKAADMRHEIFLKVIDMLCAYQGQALKDLAETAGVHWTTLYNWQRGEVYSPQLNKVAAVAFAMGYVLVLERAKGQPRLRRIK